VCKNDRGIVREHIANQTSLLIEHARLERLSLPGLTPWNFIVFTDKFKGPDNDCLKHIFANRVDAYFPGITPIEIALQDHEERYVLGKVGPLSPKTERRILVEQFDTYLPLLANGVAILVLVLWCLWPMADTFMEKVISPRS
jgi:hypothetical protein